MKKFDFDVENIINIQPKTRSIRNNRRSIFESIQGYFQKSFIFNEYKIVKAQSEKKDQSNNTELRQIIDSISVQGNEAFKDVNIEILKPEIICLLEFKELFKDNNPTLANTFIQYGITYKQYKETQIRSILERIEASKSEDLIALKNAKQEFKQSFENILNAIKLITQPLFSRFNDLHELKISLASCRDFNSLQSINNDLFQLVTSLGLTEVDFANLSNEKIFKRLAIEVRRNILFTSKKWDTNNRFVSINIEQFEPDGLLSFPFLGLFVENRYRNQLRSDVSPFITSTATINNIKSAYHLLSQASHDQDDVRVSTPRERLLLLLSIFTTEIAASRELQSLRERTQKEFYEQNKILDFSKSVFVDNELMFPLLKLRLQNSENFLKPLAFKHELSENELTVEDTILDTIENPRRNQQYAITKDKIKVYLDNHFKLNTQNESYSRTTQGLIGRRSALIFTILSDITDIFNTVFNLKNDAIKTNIETAFLEATNSVGQDFRDVIQQTNLTDELLINITGQRLNTQTYKPMIDLFYGNILLMTLLNDEFISKYILQFLFINSPDIATVQYMSEDAARQTRRNGDFQLIEADGNTLEVFTQGNKTTAVRAILNSLNSSLGQSLTSGNIANLTNAIVNGNDASLINEALSTKIFGDNATIKIKFIANIGSALNLPTNISVPFGTAVFSLFNLLLSDNPINFVDKLNRKFESRVSLDTTISKQQRFSNKQTIFSGYDINVLRTMYFIIIRDFVTINSPFTLARERQDVLRLTIDTSRPTLGRMLLTDFQQRKDINELISPILEQFSLTLYDKYFRFIDYMKRKLIPEQTDPFASDEFISANITRDIVHAIDSIEAISGINIRNQEQGNLLRREALSQLSLIMTLIKQYSSLQASNIGNTIINFDNAISNQEFGLMTLNLKSGGSTGFITNETLNENDQTPKKLLAIGIPVGFKQKINELLISQNNNQTLFANDLNYSKIVIEIYEKNIVDSNEFNLLKRSKFDIDLFVDKSYFYSDKNINSLNDLNKIKFFDKNDVNFESKTFENIQDNFIERRNEFINHLLKMYIKLIYGFNFNENYFFADRNILDINIADSNNNEFTTKFMNVVNSLVNENMKAVSKNKNNLKKNIQFLTNVSKGNILKQYSNNLETILTRNLQQETTELSDEDKKIKDELELEAFKLSQVFGYSTDIIGGKGFFKRLVSPKLFEKIIIIDIPCHSNCIADYYVKIKINRSEANNIE